MKSELGGGKLLLVHFCKYRQAKYKMAIECADIAVKPPLVTWSVSQVQYLHV